MTASLKDARAWAEHVLPLLREMSLNDRLFWRAVKPRGEMFFNWRKVAYVCHHLPEFLPQFQDLGIVGR